MGYRSRSGPRMRRISANHSSKSSPCPCRCISAPRPERVTGLNFTETAPNFIASSIKPPIRSRLPRYTDMMIWGRRPAATRCPMPRTASSNAPGTPRNRSCSAASGLSKLTATRRRFVLDTRWTARSRSIRVPLVSMERSSPWAVKKSTTCRNCGCSVGSPPVNLAVDSPIGLASATAIFSKSKSRHSAGTGFPCTNVGVIQQCRQCRLHPAERYR